MSNQFLAGRRPLVFTAVVAMSMLLGCNRSSDGDAIPQASDSPTASSSNEATDPVQAAQPEAIDSSSSFQGYTLPLRCERTSDSRKETASGKFNNVIVFSCPSEDSTSVAQATKEHLRSEGFIVDDEPAKSDDAQSFVARKSGIYTMTMRVAEKQGESNQRALVRVQWFSKE